MAHIIGGSKTDRGRRRRRNEDRILLRVAAASGWTVAAVADGMGGAAGGDIASREAIAAFDAAILGKGTPPRETLTRAFGEAEDAVRARVAAAPALRGAGTTLVAAIADGRSVWVANVGDSRAYKCGRSSCEQLTRDHSLVEDGVRAGVLTEEEAASSRYRNVITRTIGSGDGAKPDIYGPIPFGAGETLVLCSDGLYSQVDEAELLEGLDGVAPQETCDRLVALANARGGPDNISIVVIRALPAGD